MGWYELWKACVGVSSTTAEGAWFVDHLCMVIQRRGETAGGKEIASGGNSNGWWWTGFDMRW